MKVAPSLNTVDFSLIQEKLGNEPWYIKSTQNIENTTNLERKMKIFDKLCQEVIAFADPQNNKFSVMQVLYILQSLLKGQIDSISKFCQEAPCDQLYQDPYRLLKIVCMSDSSCFFPVRIFTRNFEYLAEVNDDFYVKLVEVVSQFSQFSAQTTALKSAQVSKNLSQIAQSNIHITQKHVEKLSPEQTYKLVIFLLRFFDLYERDELDNVRQPTYQIAECFHYFFTKDVDAFALILKKIQQIKELDFQKEVKKQIRFDDHVGSILLGFFKDEKFFERLYKKHPSIVSGFVNQFRSHLNVFYDHEYVDGLDGICIFFKYHFKDKVEYISALTHFFRFDCSSEMSFHHRQSLFEHFNKAIFLQERVNFQHKAEFFDSFKNFVFGFNEKIRQGLLYRYQYEEAGFSIYKVKVYAQYLSKLPTLIKYDIVSPDIYEQLAKFLLESIELFAQKNGFEKAIDQLTLLHYFFEQEKTKGRIDFVGKITNEEEGVGEYVGLKKYTREFFNMLCLLLKQGDLSTKTKEDIKFIKDHLFYSYDWLKSW